MINKDTKKSIKFPKIVKHLKNFLTDESGKITKHNALGLWAIGTVLTGIEGTEWHHHSNGWWPAWSVSRSFSPANPNFSPGITWDWRTFRSSGSCATHSSGINNGIYNDITIPLSGAWYSATHSSWGHSWSTNLPFSNATNSMWTATVTDNRSFYLDCWAVNQPINGHYSSQWSMTSARSVAHTSSHSNY